MRLHEDELEIDLPLVRALVDRAVPGYAGRPLKPLAASGSSNALFRLGDDLVMRLPRQPGGSATIDKEARWLPYLAAALPVTIPEVVLVGPPGLGYPERWSIVRWIEGSPPEPHTGGDGLARELAELLAALAALPVPAEALADPALHWYRGAPLASFDATMRASLADCRQLPGLDLDVNACEQMWNSAIALAGSAQPVEPRWLHADLLAENLLVRDGRLAAVLDFGALTVGDPTVDLIAGWEVLDPSGRVVFRSLLDVDEASWERGRAWALAIAVMTFPYYGKTMPGRCADRLAMAQAVLADAGC
ncbi:MAG: aminoglycoside phosphotransferase family protein [Jatrophihabitantaceae bacterium]